LIAVRPKRLLSFVEKTMQTNALDWRQYDTDKIENRYLEWYELMLAHLRDRPIALLELGVKNGGSLLLWRDHFPDSLVCGIDKNLRNLGEGVSADPQIKVFEGSQQDTRFLSRVARLTAPEGFDVIIDDASHIGDLSRLSFWHLFDNHLKPGGYYVIEDWTTGYWSDWSDGRTFRPRSRWWQRTLQLLRSAGIVRRIPADTHRYGMVGFLKELIDEMGSRDLTRRLHANPPGRASRFYNLTIFPSVAFIQKRAPGHCA
jgi:hypothetical protein